MKKLYRFYVYCGRMGSLEGIFVADSSDVDKAMGRTAYFDEVLGKHSEITVPVPIDAENTVAISDDQSFIAKWEELKIGNVGQNPLDYLNDEEDEEEESEVEGAVKELERRNEEKSKPGPAGGGP